MTMATTQLGMAGIDEVMMRTWRTPARPNPFRWWQRRRNPRTRQRRASPTRERCRRLRLNARPHVHDAAEHLPVMITHAIADGGVDFNVLRGDAAKMPAIHIQNTAPGPLR